MALLLAGLLFFILQAYWQRKRSQAQLAEQNEMLSRQRDELESLNNQLNEATQSKLRFFTNVSHDLRTPLTLISEPVATVAGAPNLTSQQRTLMRLAEKNVLILRRLINQILDFRKFENDHLQLRLSESDIRGNLNSWAETFIPLARRRHIDFKVNAEIPQPTMMAYDEEKMERIFFNLMSNAFKFTPDNGKIRVDARIEGENLVMSISNTGEGIKAEDLPYIFDRFYQAADIMPRGSGIGLALVKAFAELHSGSVSVASELGKETVFTVTIPVTHTEKSGRGERVASGESEITRELAEVTPGIDGLPPSEEEDSATAPGEKEGEENEKPLLLVIDDTSDIRMLLRTLLSDEYSIIEAADGKQGIRMASKYSPDLIICDMMMPEMDGMECCSRLKEEITTSHIPILMLTACKLDEQRADTYEAGADGYISKPFSNEVLRARCHSLIANRRRLTQSQIMPTAGKPKTSDGAEAAKEKGKSAARRIPNDPLAVENDFYKQFLEIVDAELGNADISVEEIGSRLGLSRVQFYRKIKALTNFSPVEIIRIRRLNEAYRLLTSTEKTVSEIAYSIGFSSPGYFSKCFKEQFGELPADLQRRTSKI